MFQAIRFIRLGDIDSGLFTGIVERTASTLGCETKAPVSCPLDASAFEPRKNQYSSQGILESLRSFAEPGVPAVAILAADLSYPGLNFVFGLADRQNSLAAVSVARFGPDRDKVLERAVKTALHEAGHLAGLQHCTDQRCVMVLSFGLRDTDFKRAAFCEACRTKIGKGRIGPAG